MTFISVNFDLEMSSVFFFALAVHCGFSGTTFVVLERVGNLYEVVDRYREIERERQRERERKGVRESRESHWFKRVLAGASGIFSSTSVQEDSYTYPGTGLIIWRGEDSNLYIKDTSETSRKPFYFRKIGGSRLSEKLIENKEMKLTSQEAKVVYVGAVYRRKREVLFIFDSPPKTESTHQYMKSYVKNMNFRAKNAVNVYISYPHLLSSFREYPQRHGLSIINIEDGGNESIECYSMHEARSRIEFFGISAVLIGKTLNIFFKPRKGVYIFSSAVEKVFIYHAEFDYKDNDIYIGTFVYKVNYVSRSRYDFFIGLTEENFYQYYKKSQEAIISYVKPY